jgi:hypothetical protein
MKGRWTWVFIVVLGLVAVLFIVSFRERKVRFVQPDGREFILRDVTFGTNHSQIIGNIFKKAAARVLPAKLKARFRINQLTVVPGAEMRELQTLVAWVDCSPPTNVVLRIRDDDGHEHAPERGHISTAGFGSTRIDSHLFTHFPRRSRFLTLRVYTETRTSRNYEGEFRVRNPAYRKYPTWKPEPLPITRETNDLTFTLTRFETGVRATNDFAWMGLDWTEIEYEYGPADFISGPWTPVEIVISDPTGNRIRRHRPTQGFITGVRLPSKLDARRRWIVSVPAMLWLDEPAWRIHLELERTARSGFRSNEIWEVNDIAVPRLGETNYVRQSTFRYGTNIVFEALATYEAGNRPFPNPIIKLEMKYPQRSSLRVFLQNVTDQRGERVFTTEFYLHPLSPESQRLNFRFVIHQMITVDFVARPELGTNRVLNPVRP